MVEKGVWLGLALLLLSPVEAGVFDIFFDSDTAELALGGASRPPGAVPPTPQAGGESLPQRFHPTTLWPTPRPQVGLSVRYETPFVWRQAGARIGQWETRKRTQSLLLPLENEATGQPEGALRVAWEDSRTSGSYVRSGDATQVQAHGNVTELAAGFPLGPRGRVGLEHRTARQSVEVASTLIPPLQPQDWRGEASTPYRHATTALEVQTAEGPWEVGLKVGRSRTDFSVQGPLEEQWIVAHLGSRGSFWQPFATFRDGEGRSYHFMAHWRESSGRHPVTADQFDSGRIHHGYRDEGLALVHHTHSADWPDLWVGLYERTRRGELDGVVSVIPRPIGNFFGTRYFAEGHFRLRTRGLHGGGERPIGHGVRARLGLHLVWADLGGQVQLRKQTAPFVPPSLTDEERLDSRLRLGLLAGGLARHWGDVSVEYSLAQAFGESSGRLGDVMGPPEPGGPAVKTRGGFVHSLSVTTFF